MNYNVLYNFALNELKDDVSGHDIMHIKRVCNNAYHILEKEGGDEIIVITSCLLHDCIDYKLFKDVNKQILKIKELLNSLNYTKDQIDEILYIINNISFSKGNYLDNVSLNLQIVRDADRLDALGSIGIIRCIEYGHSKGRKFYEEDNLKIVNDILTFNKCTNTSLSHFYEKLFLLKDLMHTKTGALMASKRHQMMVDFINQFYEELK